MEIVTPGLKTDHKKKTQKPTIFYTVAKSDCTRVVSIFFKWIGRLEEARAYNSWIHYYRWRRYIPRNPVRLSDLRSRQFIKLKFVRCPYDRAVSSFIHVQREKLRPHYLANDSFLSYLRRLKRSYGQQINRRVGKQTVNPHVASQSFVGELGPKPIAWDAIIHIEQLDQELERANRKLGLDIPTIDNFSSYHWVTKSKPTGRFLGAKVWSQLDSINYNDFYQGCPNDETRRLVEELYRLDFQAHPEYTFKRFLERNR